MCATDALVVRRVIYLSEVGQSAAVGHISNKTAPIRLSILLILPLFFAAGARRSEASLVVRRHHLTICRGLVTSHSAGL